MDWNKQAWLLYYIVIPRMHPGHNCLLYQSHKIDDLFLFLCLSNYGKAGQGIYSILIVETFEKIVTVKLATYFYFLPDYHWWGILFPLSLYLYIVNH